MRQEVKLSSEREEVLKGMVEGKIRMQSRATENIMIKSLRRWLIRRTSTFSHAGHRPCLESSRRRQDGQGVMSEFAVKEMRERREDGGDWNQKGKQRRWKPKLFRTGWKASTWTQMVKVAP